MGIIDDFGSAVSGLGTTLFGDGNDTGLMGTGHQRFDQHDIDKQNFQDPNSAGTMSELDARRRQIDGRQAPTSAAAQQSGIREYGGAHVGALERAQGAQLGPAAQGQGASIFRGEDQQFRQRQTALAQQLALQAEGKGPSLAEGQLRQATDRNIAQQRAVAAAGGGNPAMAQRQAALMAAQAQRQAGADAAQMRIQEQIAARQQLQGVLGQGREQDIGVANSQAQLLQQMNLANVQARNQFGLTQGQMDQQNNQFNAGAYNSREALQAQLAQQAGLSSQQQYNAMLAQNTANQQATSLANMQSQLQTMGLNDAQVRYLLESRMTQAERDRQANMDYEKLMTNQDLGYGQLEQGAYEAAAKRKSSFLASLAGGFTSFIPGMGGGGGAGGAAPGAGSAPPPRVPASDPGY